MSTLSTAQEYIDTYYNKLKKELNARGLQISKVGLIGLLLNILGFSQQDIKLYYDTLFREAFLATADKDENITLHGSVFGYTPGLGKPASITGNISFDLTVLPISTDNNRTITLQDLELKVDKLTYTLDSKYIFKGTNCQIIDTTGNVTTVPISTNSPLVPIQNFLQYEKEVYTNSIPFYVYNSYYSLIIELDSDTDKFVSGLIVEVKEDGKEEFETYEWKLVTYSSRAQDKHVFVQFLEDKILIELGSGVHGKYIPNSTVKCTIQTTYGVKGNISSQEVTPISGNLRVYDNASNASYSVSVSSGVIVEIDYASNGENPLKEQELRAAIIEFIRHRNNMMSESDFYDIVKQYCDDFELMFKKTHVMDNNIYLFVPFRDLYQVPVRTRSISLPHALFNPTLRCYLYHPTWTLENGKEYISPFLYVIDFTLRQYKAYILQETSSAFFNEVVTNYVPKIGSEIVALPLTFYTSYSPTLDTTRLMVQSYEDITGYIFILSIPELNIKDVCMNVATNNIVDTYWYDNVRGTGIIFDKMNIVVDVYKDGKHYFTYKLNDFSVIQDISDILSLKTFDGLITDYEFDDKLTPEQQQLSTVFNEKAYVLNIPVLDNDTYQSNPPYYLEKGVNLFGSIAFQENRMISDDVQIRYINSDVIFGDILKKMCLQKYDFDITLPLHLRTKVYVNSEYVNEHEINIIEEREELHKLLAQTMFDTYTGTSISFYETQIIEIIHNLKWVKWCQVFVTDDKGVAIPNNNIESNPQQVTINNLSKFEAVTYCPYYFHWDLNNIIVDLAFE